MRKRLGNKYVKTGLMLFVTAVLIIIFYYSFNDFADMFKTLGKITVIVQPFIYGFVMAYLVTPIYNACMRRMKPFLDRKMNGSSKTVGLSRVFSTLVSMLVLLVAMVGIVILILPDLLNNVMEVVKALPTQLTRLSNWIAATVTKYPGFVGTVEAMIGNIQETVIPALQAKLLPSSTELLSTLSSSLITFLIAMKDVLIGLIICVYMLNIKETLIAQGKKAAAAFCSEDRYNDLCRACTFTNNTFSGFISGKILDSAIIGILCFAVMSILGWPMALLISVIIGVTNIIPFFGPFIGAVPSAVLLFIERPVLALYFIIFVLILQIFDGYILGPKVLGETTGLASFWVMFAILIGGGFAGFIGMIVGVPVFAVIYQYVKIRIEGRLERKDLATETAAYKNLDVYKPREAVKIKKFMSRIKGSVEGNTEEAEMPVETAASDGETDTEAAAGIEKAAEAVAPGGETDTAAAAGVEKAAEAAAPGGETDIAAAGGENNTAAAGRETDAEVAGAENDASSAAGLAADDGETTA